MADEEIVVPAPEVAEEIKLETNTASRGAERNKDLADKVKLTAEERDKEKSGREAAEKKVDFYKNLGKLSKKYPDAADFEDKILEKVEKGYDIDDATVAVLSKAGKLNSMNQGNPARVERDTVAGGASAVNNPQVGAKSAAEMTQAERYEALKQIPSADIANAFKEASSPFNPLSRNSG